MSVEWFTAEELEEQFTELLEYYRYCHLSREEWERESPKDKSDIQQNARVAIDTFHAMFRGLMLDDDFLLGPDQDAIMATLLGWADEVSPALREGADEAQSTRTLPAAEECSTHLMQLTSEETSSRRPSLWPYIRKIK